MIVERINPPAWTHTWMHICYPYTFNEARPQELERINYALIAHENKVPVVFTTVIEMDSETAYWQFGGAMNQFKKSIRVLHGMEQMINWEREHHKRITIKMENTNLPMIKLCLATGFLVHGTWNYKNKIYVELLNEFGGN